MGHSLASQFEQSMQFEDASDEEAPPLNPKKKEMLKHAQLQMISMLQTMKTDNGL